MSELLERLRSLSASRRDQASEIGRLVSEARAGGATWQEIGEALGVTRQAAQKMYGAAVPRAGEA